jgi:hypothetical protein
MTTWGQLKTKLRNILFAAGEEENLIAPHDQSFLTAIVDLQTWVQCLQQDNTSIFPHCSTFFHCGMTIIPAPRGNVSQVSVVDSVARELPEGIEAPEDIGGTSASTAPQLTTIGPAIEIPISSATVGTTVNKSYIINPAETTWVKIQGSGNGSGTAYSMVATITITPTDGSAAAVTITKTVTDSALSFTFQDATYGTLLSSASADAYKVDLSLQLTGLSGNASQQVHENHTAYIDIAYWKIGAVSPGTGGGGAVTPPATTMSPEWCSEVIYAPVDYCHVRDYINRSNSLRGCLPFALYFALPSWECEKGVYPTPTGEGLPPGLPILPLGYVHAQTSTDATKRALKGTWAMERGKIYVGPWIQSTEMVVVKWDGIKREWSDGDPIDSDPLLEEALMAWVECEHRRRWEKDADAAMTPDLDPAYQSARQRLIHQCREETRTRACSEVSHARSSPGSVVSLYFNDEQRYTAECQGGTTGADVTQVILAGTVGSSVSKEDANAKAREEARTQAEARLVCTPSEILYWNDAVSYTADCTTDEEHPPVEGSPVTVAIPANTYSSSVSKAAANALAEAAAIESAEAQRNCTWFNKEVTYTADCPDGTTGSSVTKTVAAKTYSSTVSQQDADNQATANAKLQAEEELICDGSPTVFYNTPQQVLIQRVCQQRNNITGFYTNCQFRVTVSVAAGRFSDTVSVLNANNNALSAANALGNQVADQQCIRLFAGLSQCGNIATAI